MSQASEQQPPRRRHRGAPAAHPPTARAQRLARQPPRALAQRHRLDHRTARRCRRMGRHAAVRPTLRADPRRPRAPQSPGQADRRRRLQTRQGQAPTRDRGLQTVPGPAATLHVATDAACASAARCARRSRSMERGSAVVVWHGDSARPGAALASTRARRAGWAWSRGQVPSRGLGSLGHGRPGYDCVRAGHRCDLRED